MRNQQKIINYTAPYVRNIQKLYTAFNSGEWSQCRLWWRVVLASSFQIVSSLSQIPPEIKTNILILGLSLRRAHPEHMKCEKMKNKMWSITNIIKVSLLMNIEMLFIRISIKTGICNQRQVPSPSPLSHSSLIILCERLN